MQQTNFPIEIIINDDCSTDGTTEIIREYAEKYPDKIFPVFHEENLYSQGVRGMAQKFVYPKARGKYIAICEGDDYWTDPLKLQKQVDFLESHPDYSMCFHKAKTMYESGLSGVEFFSKIETREYHAHEIMLEWFIPTASIVVKNEVAKTAPNHTDFQSGDDVLQANSCRLGRVYGMSDEMSVYRRHVGAWSYNSPASSNFRIKSIPHYLAMLEVFSAKIMQPRKRWLAFSCFLWLRYYKQYQSLVSLQYLPRVLRYCGSYFIYFLLMSPVNYITRRLGIQKITLEEIELERERKAKSALI